MMKPYHIVGRVRVSVRGLHSGFNSWINAVAVGNSGAIWMGAGGLTISRSRRPFRIANLRFILIEQRYSLHSGLLCMHEPVLHFICGFCANHLHNNAQSRLAASLPAVIRLSDRTGRFWWVTEQNKDGAKCECAVLEGRSTCILFFIMPSLSF